MLRGHYRPLLTFLIVSSILTPVVVFLSPRLNSAPAVEWRVTKEWVEEDPGFLSGHWSLQSDPRHSLMVTQHSNSKLWEVTTLDNLSKVVSDLKSGAESVNVIAGIQDWTYTHQTLTQQGRWKILTLTASYLDVKGLRFTSKEKFLISEKTISVMTLTFPSEDDRWSQSSPLDEFAPSEVASQ